jgi:hypothetical protein
MSTTSEDVTDIVSEDQHATDAQDHVIPLACENSPEETIRRMEAFPERAAKFMELIRALREADTR